MTPPVVAIVDIGSNSIKVLVAARGEQGQVIPLLTKSVDARISAGISAAEPQLTDEGMTRGISAVQELLAAANVHTPGRTLLVATSAVRDATNRGEFLMRLKAATGHEVRILRGEEEAAAIGRGLVLDPALTALRDFCVFDLGGGSLECLAFANRELRQAVSFQLGCVRLMEKFVPDPNGPTTAESQLALRNHVIDTLSRGDFRFDAGAAAVGTGGTVATVRGILGARTGLKVEETPAVVTTAQLRGLLEFLVPMTTDLRRRVPGLPPGRADVFPTALVTILALAEVGGFTEFHHSFHNLRFGLAAELLELS